MSEKITEAELLEALAEATAGNGPEDARTTNELLAEHRMSRDRLLGALRAASTQGRLVVHYVFRTTILGTRVRVPAYTFRAAKKRKRA